jgi:putative tryptophan/tyrosine transport system substrate-binding protein
MNICLRRREFVGLLGGAAAWPLAARAQQPKMPGVGILLASTPEAFAGALAAFQQGLADAGFLVSQNVVLETRSANFQSAKLPSLAEDLVNSHVAVIFAANSTNSVLAAKAATTTIPIVFFYGGDPVSDGLVASLSRPGGNLTGMTSITTELTAKRLGLLHELVPNAKTIGLLTGSFPRREHRNDILAGAQALGLQVVVVEVEDNAVEVMRPRLERAFATFAERQAEAVFVDNYAHLFFNSPPIISLAARHKIPAMYASAAPVRIGGLIGYGNNGPAAYRQAATQYVARILKGAKPADLPVQQPTRFELVINLKTAKALGIEVPTTLLAIADELIE